MLLLIILFNIIIYY